MSGTELGPLLNDGMSGMYKYTKCVMDKEIIVHVEKTTGAESIHARFNRRIIQQRPHSVPDKVQQLDSIEFSNDHITFHA